MENETVIMGSIKIDGWKCERCGHIWAPRLHEGKNEFPTTCPACKTAYWNKPKKSRKIEESKK